MNYEERYKEALKRAKRIFSQTKFDYEKGMMEEIFPELKDSEDEEIRKEMIDHFWADKIWREEEKYPKNDPNYLFDLKAIAWLEKQKPIEWSEEDENRLNEAILMVESNGTWVRSDDGVKLVSSWLKSIKQKRFVEQQISSTFTKEDEAYQNGYHDCEKDLANKLSNKLDAGKVIEWIRRMKIAKGCKIVHISDKEVVKQFKKDFGI